MRSVSSLLIHRMLQAAHACRATVDDCILAPPVCI